MHNVGSPARLNAAKIKQNGVHQRHIEATNKHQFSSFVAFLSGSLLPVPNAFSLLSNMRGKPRRGMLRRAVFSDLQRKGLEKTFQKQKYISKPDRKKLADKLGLKDSQVRSLSCTYRLPESKNLRLALFVNNSDLVIG